MKARIKALYARIPAYVKSEAGHVAATFGAAFAAVAGPLLPEFTRTPSMAALKALAAAGVAAGVRAAYPVAKAALTRIAARLLRTRA